MFWYQIVSYSNTENLAYVGLAYLWFLHIFSTCLVCFLVYWSPKEYISEVKFLSSSPPLPFPLF